jgi:hypothetical protein
MLAAEEVKACCAGAYGSAAVRWLVGDRLHPGGAQLTARLVAALGVGAEDTVVDVASGPGTSALQLAQETGCEVVGVDLSPAAVAAATRAATGVARVRFVVGDAEVLPLADQSVDGALCECSLCLFPDKEAAAGELARVLRPGARLALSDVTAVSGRLPPELRGLAGWAACLADARPLAEIKALFEEAGFAVEQMEHHDEALEALLERVEARLRAARALQDGLPVELGGRIPEALGLVDSARRSVAEGVLGYGILVARRL